MKIKDTKHGNDEGSHISVLLEESINSLNLKNDDVFFDGTLGAGGHSALVCKMFGNNVSIIGTDKDEDAVKRSSDLLSSLGCKPSFFVCGFDQINEVLEKTSINGVDKVLLDLGISSIQLENSGRGFTFQKDEPLLMTMKVNPKENDLTAYDIVNNWSQDSIYSILKGYGEEKNAFKIARAIVSYRESSPIKTTDELSLIIKSVSRGGGKINPATKTFQALRIAVNDEIRGLPESLEKIFSILRSGGRIAVISFHSIEDRIVKNFFKEKASQSLGTIVFKKPIVPKDEEVLRNKRSRSAKLRVFEKK